MAELGHEVLGVEIDDAKRASLSAGRAPFHEPGLDALLATHVATGRLRFTDSFAEAADFGDLHFLCVGTPQSATGLGADLTAVVDAVESLAVQLTRPTLLVGKSTVPVGTAARLAERMAELAPVGAAAELAWNPEFLREGFAVKDTLHPDRIVVGVESRPDSRAEAVLRALYAPLLDCDTPFLVTGLTTAELVKVAANAFLATKISFINAIAEVCEVTSANIGTLADAIGYDDRIGRRFLNAGLGFGGGCLSKDIRGFISRANELGVGDSLRFLREVDDLNCRRRRRIVDITRQECGSLAGVRVAVLGAAFKPDTDDIRDSPALDVANQIHSEGAEVTVYDPKAMDNARKAFPSLNYAFSAVDACSGADSVLVLTEWDEFRNMRPHHLSDVTRSKSVIDARNCLDPYEWRAAGWTYRGFGRP